MIVLDTNVISELMKVSPDKSVLGWLTQIEVGPLATSAVTVMEIEFGIARLPDGQRKVRLHSHFEIFIGAIRVLPLDEVASRLAGRFRAKREASGLPAEASDMMIAGITATADAILATRNTRDFDGLPVRVVNPWVAR